MNAGQMNEQVAVYIRETESDGMGGKRSSLVLSFTDWAKVERVSSNRRADEGRLKNDIRYRITMASRLDWSASVDGADFPDGIAKVVYRGRNLVLNGPALESEDRLFVTFECIEQQV